MDNPKFEIQKLTYYGFECKILVNASQQMKQLLDIYDLTPAEFFRPFGDFKEEIINFKTLKSQQKSIQNYRVNFVDRNAYIAPQKQLYDNYSRSVLSQYKPNLNYNENNFNYEQILQNTAQYNGKWLRKTSEPLFDLCHYNPELNFLDQPVCILNCIHITDGDIDKQIKQIHADNKNFYSNFFRYNEEDIFETGSKSQVCFANFIFVDTQNQQQIEQGQNVLKTLNKKFPYQFNRVINLFGNTQQNKLEHNIFKQFQKSSYRYYYSAPDPKHTQSRQDTLKLITENDCGYIKNAIKDMFKNHIFKWMEGKLYQLNTQYQELKKTSLSKSLSKFLNRTKDQTRDGIYYYTPKEIVLRHLGDLNFLVHEYDQAAFFYKALMDEVQKKSAIHYANALESYSISQLMCEEISNKLEQNLVIECLQNAITNYISQKQLAPYMIRALIYYIYSLHLFDKWEKQKVEYVQTQSHKIRMRSKRNNDSQQQSDEEFPLMNLVINEQFAAMYLKLNQPRKYCLNTLFTGYQYGSQGFKYHAINAFLKIVAIYTDINWLSLSDFVYRYITKYTCETGHTENAIDYMKKSLNNIQRNDNNERHLQIISDSIKVLSTLDKFNLEIDQRVQLLSQGETLNLPQINEGSVDIIVYDELLHTNTQSSYISLRSIQDERYRDKINKYQSQLTKDQQNIWYQYGQELLKTENKGMLEDLRDKKLLQSMGSACIEQKQRIFQGNNDIINLKYYRLAYVQEQLDVICQLNNIVHQEFDLKDFKIIYEYYDTDNKLVYSNNNIEILKSQQISRQQQSNQLENIGDDLLDLGSDSTNATTNNVDDPNQYVKVVSKSLVLHPQEKQAIKTTILPQKPGYVIVKGFQWQYMNIPTQKILNFENTYANKFKILEKQIQLDVKVLDTEEQDKLDLYYCQIKPIKVQLKNLGEGQVEKIEIRFIEPWHFGQSTMVLDNLQLTQNNSEIINLNIRGFEEQDFESKLLIKYKNAYTTRYTRHIIPISIKQSISVKYNIYSLFNQTSMSLNINLKPEKEKQLMNKEVNQDLLDLDFAGGNNNQNKSNVQIEKLLVLSKDWDLKQIGLNRNKNDYQYIQLLLKQNQEEISVSQQNLESHHQNSQKNNLLDIGLDDEDPYTLNIHKKQKSTNQLELQQNSSQQQLFSTNDLQEQDENFVPIEYSEFKVIDITQQNQEDQGELMKSLNSLQLQEMDNETLQNFVNLDHKFYYQQYWNQDDSIPFNSPHLASFLIIFSIIDSNGIKQYGLYDIVKKPMNYTLISSIKYNYTPFNIFPIKFKLFFPKTISFDFNENEIASIPVKIQLTNIHSPVPVHFKLEAIDGDQPLEPTQEQQYPSFDWDGQTQIIAENMRQGDIQEFDLILNIYQAGTYDISRFRLSFYRNPLNNSLISPNDPNFSEIQFEKKVYSSNEIDHHIIQVNQA